MLKKALLSFALAPALLGVAGAAFADALPMPAGYPTLLGASCGGVHVTTYVTGFNADGTVAGEVYAWTSCSTGGRGSKPRKIEAYHTMAWDFFGGYTVSAYDGGPLVSGTFTDSYGNVDTSYTGTVHFTSSDANAVLPADTALVNGAATVNVTFMTVGTQTLQGPLDVALHRTLRDRHDVRYLADGGSRVATPSPPWRCLQQRPFHRRPT